MASPLRSDFLASLLSPYTLLAVPLGRYEAENMRVATTAGIRLSKWLHPDAAVELDTFNRDNYPPAFHGVLMLVPHGDARKC